MNIYDVRDWRWWGNEIVTVGLALILLPLTLALFAWMASEDRRDPYFDKHD